MLSVRISPSYGDNFGAKNVSFMIDCKVLSMHHERKTKVIRIMPYFAPTPTAHAGYIYTYRVSIEIAYALCYRSFYNKARALVLPNSYRAIMKEIFVYARPCVYGHDVDVCIFNLASKFPSSLLQVLFV